MESSYYRTKLSCRWWTCHELNKISACYSLEWDDIQYERRVIGTFLMELGFLGFAHFPGTFELFPIEFAFVFRFFDHFP